MSGEILASRAELVAALAAAGIRHPGAGDPLIVPGAWIRPAEPWLAPHSVGPFGSRLARWSVLLIAGAADQTSSLEQLVELTDRGIPALDRLARWSVATAARAVGADLFGTLYLVAELVLETPIEITAPEG
jgi:hypothetical protein